MGLHFCPLLFLSDMEEVSESVHKSKCTAASWCLITVFGEAAFFGGLLLFFFFSVRSGTSFS